LNDITTSFARDPYETPTKALAMVLSYKSASGHIDKVYVKIPTLSNVLQI